MPNKETQKICKELDEEGYYRWIKERDEKRYNRFKFWERGRIKKVLRSILHITGTHLFDQVPYRVKVDDFSVYIYTCETCGYECTRKGITLEIAKWVLTLIAMIAAWGCLYFINLLFPFLSFPLGCIFAFFTIIHCISGLVCLLKFPMG